MSNIVVDKSKVPWWVSNVIVPLVNLTLALLVSGLFVFIAGENPIEAVKLIIYGSFGYIQGFAYTLYYTTNFIFTGLAFAVAFHCRLFNIGGEGQAYIGGLGVFLVAINLSFLPVPIVWLLAIFGAFLFYRYFWSTPMMPMSDMAMDCMKMGNMDMKNMDMKK